MKFILEKTCSACPEQYDVYLDGTRVGYLRLRHGVFTCKYPDSSGEIIYIGYPKGDGIFDDDERDTYIRQALIHIMDYLDIKDMEYKIK